MFPLSKFVLITSALFVVRLAATKDINLEDSNTDAPHLANDPIDSTVPETHQKVDERFREMVEKAPGGRLYKIGQGKTRESIEEIRRVFQQSPPLSWSMWQNGDKPTCFIEVQVPQKIPGKCTKLGGTIPACQSQDLLTIDYTSCGP